MSQFLGFGDGAQGDKVVSGTETINAYIGLSGNASAGQKIVNVTDAASFAAGDWVIIHQSRGGGIAGRWELNIIDSKSTNQLTMKNNLDYTYEDDGSSKQAQIIKVPRYRSFYVPSGTIVLPTEWDGEKGGWIVWTCAGKSTVEGLINGEYAGFRGGDYGIQQSRKRGGSGEGTNGWSYPSDNQDGPPNNPTNETGGGGGYGRGAGTAGGGGGGGNGTSGENGGNSGASGGGTNGSVDLTNMNFGGGGGGGGASPGNSTSYHGGQGGDGGGTILWFSRDFECITGTIRSHGQNGGASHRIPDDENGGGGGGAGGSIKGMMITSNIATDRILAQGGARGPGSKSDQYGGVGGDGRVRLERCSELGSADPANPAASSVIGGKEWCGSSQLMM